jgi:hypothetical protein
MRLRLRAAPPLPNPRRARAPVGHSLSNRGAATKTTTTLGPRNWSGHRAYFNLKGNVKSWLPVDSWCQSSAVVDSLQIRSATSRSRR